MGNFSKDTFNKLKHYVGVRLQQGVPIVDADWNEQEDIRKYELQAFLKWFVGNGVPKGNDGFRILPVTDGAENDFIIRGGDRTPDGAGRILVEGWDAMNESDIKYTKQPLYDNDALADKWGVDPVTRLEPPTTDNRRDTVYLDIWEREVDAEEDNDLVNPAIGVETCVRLKREWAVRVAEGAATPSPPLGHAFYPLALLTRASGEASIGAADITDLRETNLSMSALTAEAVLSFTASDMNNASRSINIGFTPKFVWAVGSCNARLGNDLFGANTCGYADLRQGSIIQRCTATKVLRCATEPYWRQETSVNPHLCYATFADETKLPKRHGFLDVSIVNVSASGLTVEFHRVEPYTTTGGPQGLSYFVVKLHLLLLG